MKPLPIRRGADHPKARFSPEEVEEIRKNFDEELPTYRAAAQRYHCGRTTIYRIVNRISYRNR